MPTPTSAPECDRSEVGGLRGWQELVDRLRRDLPPHDRLNTRAPNGASRCRGTWVDLKLSLVTSPSHPIGEASPASGGAVADRRGPGSATTELAFVRGPPLLLHGTAYVSILSD